MTFVAQMLIAVAVAVVVFRTVLWVGQIWVTGAEALDEHSE